MPATTQTRKIVIKVDAPGVKEALDGISAKMGSLNKNAKSLASNFSFLTNALTGITALFGVRGLTRMSDEYQNLTSRLKITALEGEKVSDIFTKIADLAGRTNQSISSVGETYNRFAGALKSTKANSDELVALTETLINTFRVSGSGAQETANAMVQLSQAFSTGVLRGQDLRSVISQNIVFARYLKEEYKGDIFKKAEAGAITISEVIRILTKHQKELTEQAKSLAPTFEQTLTKSMNRLTISVGQLSEKFGLSTKFAKAAETVIDNLGSILTTFGGIAFLVGTTYIPNIISGLRNLRIASIAFATSNPILLALTSVTVVAALVYENFDKLTEVFNRFRASVLDAVATMEEKFLPIKEKIAKLTGSAGIFDFDKEKLGIEQMRKAAEDIRSKIDADAKARSNKGAADPYSSLNSLLGKVKNGEGVSKVQKIKEILGEINREFLEGSISLEEYNQKLINFELYKLNREFKEGKFDVFTYNQRLKELNVQELNRQLKVGIITIREYGESIRGGALDELNKKFQAGKISLIEYNAELVKISEKFLPGSALMTGTNSYLESIGTVSENIAKAISNTFSSLEDNLVDFIRMGEFNFAKFTQSILDDLTRIIIRATIIRPLAKGILGAFSGPGETTGSADLNTYSDFSNVSAKGNAFYNGSLQKFARGGIVNGPTAFSYGGGKRGLMGEAGTEAILPLQRGRGGNLGVAASTSPVIVNITNNSNAEIRQSEGTGPGGERTIEVLIQNKVREGILTGKFDSPMKSAYGLSRRGS